MMDDWVAYFIAEQDKAEALYEARVKLWREREQWRAGAPEIFFRVP